MSALDDAIDTLEQRSKGPAVGVAQRARAELAQLRADVARLTQERDAAQAAILEAQDALLPFASIPCLENFDDDQLYSTVISAGDVRQARAWLAAHPAPDNHVHLADRSGGYCVICGKPAPEAER